MIELSTGYRPCRRARGDSFLCAQNPRSHGTRRSGPPPRGSIGGCSSRTGGRCGRRGTPRMGNAPRAGVSGRSHAAEVGHYGRTIGGRSLLEVSRDGERISVRVDMNPAWYPTLCQRGSPRGTPKEIRAGPSGWTAGTPSKLDQGRGRTHTRTSPGGRCGTSPANRISRGARRAGA